MEQAHEVTVLNICPPKKKAYWLPRDRQAACSLLAIRHKVMAKMTHSTCTFGGEETSQGLSSNTESGVEDSREPYTSFNGKVSVDDLGGGAEDQ